MLGTLLDQIPGALSRRFLLGNFLPLVLFCISSLALAYTCMPQVQGFAAWYEGRPVLVQGFMGAAATLSLAAIALALSGLKTLGRLALERSVLPASWRGKLEGRHHDELESAKQSLKSVSSERHAFMRFHDSAIEKLIDARNKGIDTGSRIYKYPVAGNTISARLKEGLSKLDDLLALVDDLAAVLAANNVRAPGADAQKLDQDHVLLVKLLDDRLQALTDDYRQKSATMERDFPGAKIYATRFARVAGSLRAYAEGRYGVDYAVLWPRLEAVARKEEPQLYEALQDASAQLDFHIAMFWLTVVFVLVWTVTLAMVGLNTWLYLCVALVGPVLCGAWYDLGVRSYSALADQAFTAVDLVRLKVFDALGVVQPNSPEEERHYWAELGSSLAFGGAHAVPYRNREPEPARPEEFNVRLRIEPSST